MREIAVVTSNRAEYGILTPVLRAVRRRPELVPRLIVGGAHLAPHLGATYRHVENDGFPIDAKVDLLVAGDTPTAVGKSAGLAILGFTDALSRLRPDVVLVVGDRYETLAAAMAAALLHIPIAHLHGGEVTDGVVDDALRHAITQLASLHFVAAEGFRRRVVQLGQDAQRVYVVGAPGLDNIASLEPVSADELARSLNVTLTRPLLLVTYHPAGSDPAAGVAALLAALGRFPEATIIVTRPNVDAGSQAIVGHLDAWGAQHLEHVRVCDALGQRRYLSALRHADVVVGNSSSGIIEAPALQAPTVNIGDRQRGRPRAGSVLDVTAHDPHAIADAIHTALSPEFRARLADVGSPYGDGHAAPRIAQILATVDLQGLLPKRFHDLFTATEEIAQTGPKS